jgi:2,4-dienoyl-CoA reductase-like NADH-dependent reductase (Old Yellow Enzyme family)
MVELFQETSMGALVLPNRLVRSATWEGMCDAHGRPTEKLCRYLQSLAEGGIGLLITGFAFVRPEGKQLPGKMGIHTDDFEPDFRNLTQAVHATGAKLAVQLVHAGGQTSRASAGRQPLAPSAVKVDQFPELPVELNKEQIGRICTAFADGARRARQWGFDAIQLHGAHGYLINQFLSPLTNRRTDEYGGSLDNRARFAMQLYRRVRQAVGPDFPVMIKLNASDNLQGGLTLEDSIDVARKLSAAGIDAIEVSSGTPVSGKLGPARERIKSPAKEGYNLDPACRIKSAVTCPVMAVGGFRSFQIAQNAVKQAGVDFVAMARPLIREPDLPNRWQAGDYRPAACISCNGCFKPGLEEGGIYCVQEKKLREKQNKALRA